MTDSCTPGVGRAIGVLVCDDVDALRRLIRVVIELDSSLAVVGEAEDGRQAILQAERLQPDVVLLDLSMPVLNGIEALPAIREVAPDAQIIAFTGLSSPALEQLVLDGGAHSFLPKGASPDAITDAIKDAYAAGRVSVERERIGSPEGRL
jgi:NarL family two-component system response regulator LiaR